MRGRQKGQTKRMSKIKDSIIAPYEIWIEEDQFTLMDISKNKAIGYYPQLEHAIKKVSKLSLANQKEIYTLAGFIESYKTITNQLTEKFKNI